MKVYKFTAAKTHERLDLFLAEAFPEWSRRKVRRLIDVGSVFLNNKRVRVASRSVHRGDQLIINYTEELLKKNTFAQVSLTETDFIFENEFFLVINKPAGLASQATQSQSVSHVVSELEKLRPTLKNKLHLVHRLDKETSGAIVVAKSTLVMTELTDLFRERTVEKTYEAVVVGIPPWKNTRVENHLSEIGKKTGLVEAVNAGGKKAVTEFKVLETKKNLSLMECKPETGRSHQIRVHLQGLGFPIVGDKKYGENKVVHKHHLLHARQIEFEFKGKKFKIEAKNSPVAEFFKAVKENS